MELTVNLENLSESERENLMSLVEKSMKPESKVWKPREGECYFFIISDGGINMRSYHSNSKIAVAHQHIGNCFKTEEEAKFALRHRLVEVELQRFADEHNVGEFCWDSVKAKVYLEYDFDDCDISTNWTCNLKCANTIYFTSEEIAQLAIDTIGKERLKKYYFGIKD